MSLLTLSCSISLSPAAFEKIAKQYGITSEEDKAEFTREIHGVSLSLMNIRRQTDLEVRIRVSARARVSLRAKVRDWNLPERFRVLA
jgi:hypothetical protein